MQMHCARIKPTLLPTEKRFMLIQVMVFICPQNTILRWNVMDKQALACYDAAKCALILLFWLTIAGTKSKTIYKLLNKIEL